MLEVTYSKKQIKPLIDKYQIDVDNNKEFKNIIVMFDNQPNYQVWAIKAVFGGVCPIEVISQIKTWAENNQTEIKSLIKGNIVSYKTKTDFKQLLKEMEGLDMLSKTRNTINKFNTRQRDMLKDAVFANINNGIEAVASETFREWNKILGDMETLVKHRKEKLISTSSAIDDVNFLKEHIKSALLKSYDWSKEDMVAFMKRNTPDCSIVFENDNIVVAKIPSFKSSKLLCGNGRTGWCLTREERYFKQYVKDARNATQYFLFDFSKREDDELAHVGFTVQAGNGITNAHSTKNYSLCGDGIQYNGKKMNIQQALQAAHVPMKLTMPMKDLVNYKWSLKDFVEMIKDNENEFAICVCENNRVVVRPLSKNALKRLASHTFIDMGRIDFSNDRKVYVIADFNYEYDDNNSIIVIAYEKDTYGEEEIRWILDAYNTNIKDENYLESIDMKEEKFFKKEKINPAILLHKLINESKEEEAIKLIADEGDDFDVNFEFNQNVPIFAAIEKKQYKVFDAIINHKKFDYSTCDSFGESLLQSLMYNYKPSNVPCSNEDNEAIERMINMILNSNNFDFNVQDINLDTALIVACDRKELLWVADALVNKPEVNINVVNDFNCTALGTAIRKNNIEAIRILSRRDDLVVREEDLEMAADVRINLSDYIPKKILDEVGKVKLTMNIDDENGLGSEFAMDLSKIFAKAFGRK